jgi:iron complex transport system ATP-binding protein
MTILDARDVGVLLGRRAVLNSVSLDVEPGELLALIGPNGAGKTSLLRCLAGLLRPNTGAVLLHGQQIEAVSLPERARTLAYLPQESRVHWPISVIDLVMLGRLPHRGLGPPTAADHAAVADALSAQGLIALAVRPVTALSGGELRRVLLARALATKPNILLADEPTSALDPGCQLDVMAALKQAAAQGMAVVAVTHDLELASSFADRVALLHEGRLIADGAPLEVLSAENLARCYGVRAAANGPSALGRMERIDDRPGR